MTTLKCFKRVQVERTCKSGRFQKKFDVQGSSSSNDKYNECVGIAKILKINESAYTLFKHLRVTRLD